MQYAISRFQLLAEDGWQHTELAMRKSSDKQAFSLLLFTRFLAQGQLKPIFPIQRGTAFW